MATRGSAFSRFNQVIVCYICGKRTLADVGRGTDLCRACLTACERENEHESGYHEDQKPIDCPACNPARP